MRSLPNIDVLSELRGSPVFTVTFGQYVFHIGFYNESRLSVYAPFRFASMDVICDTKVVEFPVMETNIVRIIGCKVAEVKLDDDGSLSIIFVNNDILIVYANDIMYESYSILIEGVEYVV